MASPGLCNIFFLVITIECVFFHSGMFCHLTVCDLNPCVHGMCNLTDQDYVCICDRGYGGLQCDIKLNPCGDNPCQNSGTCVVDKDQYICKCQILFQGE